MRKGKSPINIIGSIVSGKIEKVSSVRNDDRGRRWDILYQINSPISGLTCGDEGECTNPPKWLLYMRTHKGNTSWSAYCEQHAPWFSAAYKEMNRPTT